MTYSYKNDNNIMCEFKISINLSRCYLTESPKFDSSTIYLNCQFNKFEELSELPKLLKSLNCGNNRLIKLPELPKTLIELICNKNNLSDLPDLPNSLEKLYCFENKIIELPILYNIPLSFLNCCFNNIMELPDLPRTLEYLYCNNNNIKYLSYHNDRIIKKICYSICCNNPWYDDIIQ
jgi:Leucine-rich repeat (LRR) protein